MFLMQHLVAGMNNRKCAKFFNALSEFFTSYRQNDTVMFAIDQPDRCFILSDKMI